MKHKPTILLTRPAADSIELAKKLQPKCNFVISPLMEIKLIEISEAEKKIIENTSATILLTSAQAAKALAGVTERRDLEVITVGTKTKNTANLLGFKNATSVTDDREFLKGDAVNMLKYLNKHFESGHEFIYLSGKVVTEELADKLNEIGFKANKIEVYDSVAAKEFSKATLLKLKKNEVNAVVLFSKRSAEIFNDIAEESGLRNILKNIKLICISPKVADLVEKEGWKNVSAATKPNEEAMIRQVKNLTNCQLR